MQEHLETFESLNTVVWSISPDEPGRLRSYRDKKEVTIPLLIDEGSEVIRAYGILNPRQGEVPHPTVVIVDKEGIARFFHLDEDYRRRPPAETLIEAVREIESDTVQ